MGRENCDDTTIFEILACGGRILLGNEDNGWIYSWNGSSEFTCWQHAGNSKYYSVDFWTTDVKPKDLEEAVQRCHDRLSLALSDEASNEYHDMQVDKRNGLKKSEFPMTHGVGILRPARGRSI